MTGNSIENCFVMLNKKLETKLRFKTFHRLQNLLPTAFALNTTAKPACFLKTFANPSSKRVIDCPKLNLLNCVL